MKTLPLFKSHYSIGRSILTLEKAGDSESDAPDSIIDIAKENSFNEVFLLEDSFAGFLEAYKNLSSIKVKLIFGIRLWMVPDIKEKSEDSLKKQHRVNIFAKNHEGYKKLIKIYSRAAQEGFYYEPRIDNDFVKTIWSDNDLKLAIPFYDSFVFQNNFVLGGSCVPDFSFTQPVFFRENNELPFDDIIWKHLKQFVSHRYEILPAKSIYYKNRKDFKAYLAFRCLHNRATINKPNIEHLSSAEFALESWKEMNG